MIRQWRRYLLPALTGVLLFACSSGGGQKGSSGTGGLTATGGAAGGAGSGGSGGTPGTYQVDINDRINNDLDVLFMIDDGAATGTIQQKLMAQLPTFFQVLQQLPNGMPNLHVGFVSSDLGAPGDSTASLNGCTTQGDQGQFHSQPGAGATCTMTTLSSGATFLSDVDGQANFTNPIDQVAQCVGALGSQGCGFQHQLASIARALGADGTPPPATNANFLRPDAYLGIVILTNQDDCSAPPNTTIYSLNGGGQSITNPDGPIAKYRCNGGPRGGHLCEDPATNQMIVPPLNPPPDATGNPPLLKLSNCADNTTGTSALTPVSTFINDVKTLKPDPDHQILVAAIAAPATPYGVVWVPPAQPPAGTSGELWPQVMHSCGAAGGDDVNPMSTQNPTDGSFGDPAVRISQFVSGFADSVLASVCDSSYRTSMTAIATKLGELIHGACVAPSSTIQQDSKGQPACTVTNHLVDSTGKQTSVMVPNCNENGAAAPCWVLVNDSANCPSGGLAFKLTPDQAALDAASLTSTVKCTLCQPGSVAPGC